MLNVAIKTWIPRSSRGGGEVRFSLLVSPPLLRISRQEPPSPLALTLTLAAYTQEGERGVKICLAIRLCIAGLQSGQCLGTGRWISVGGWSISDRLGPFVW